MMGFVINPSISQVAPRKPFTVSQLPNMALNALYWLMLLEALLKYFAKAKSIHHDPLDRSDDIVLNALYLNHTLPICILIFPV